MKARTILLGLCLVSGIVVLSGPPLGSRDALAAADPHAFFSALVGRTDFWKGYSFRPRAGEPISSPYYEKQFARPSDGGYQNSNSAPLYVTYDSRVDAARVAIPAFSSPGFNTTLGTAITATETHIVPSDWASYVVGRQVKIGNEIMVVTAYDPDATVPRGFTVARAQYATLAAPHAAGSPLLIAANSLPNQLRPPLQTTDGHTYLFTWDALFTSSFLNTGLAGNKTFQFTSGGDQIWLEVKTRMDGGASGYVPAGFDKNKHVGGIDVRSYNFLGGDANWLLTDGSHLGPGPTNNTPLQPMNSTFLLYPDRWTRYWVRIEQRTNDYDYFDLWVADEVQAPVQIYKHVPISVRGPDFSIQKFWLEFNDSQAILPVGRTTDFRDLVCYVRNFAALRDPGDVASLLQRPIPGLLPVPSTKPAAPSNLRIIR